MTVTLEDCSGTPVPGQTVTLAQEQRRQLGHHRHPGVTNAPGSATFSVNDATSEVVTYSATTDQPVTLDQHGHRHLPWPGQPDHLVDGRQSPPRCSTTARPPRPITVTLQDASGTPIPGETVTPRPRHGPLHHLGAARPVTNAAGVATFSVNDATSEIVTYSATDTTSSVTLSHHRATSHLPRPGLGRHLDGVANPTSVTDNGTSTSTITVTLLDSSGTPVSGQAVTFGQGTGSSVISGPATTNAAGVATFSVKDATSQASPTQPPTPANRTWPSPRPPWSPSMERSTQPTRRWWPIPPRCSTTDPATSLITVTLQDVSGTPIPGETVTSGPGHGATPPSRCPRR